MHEIEAVVKPILEEMGLYKGNDVSAKDLFEKYLNAFPQGIKTFWKFEAVVEYELSLFVKSMLFEGPDEIYILSCDPPKKAVEINGLDWRASLMSSWIGRVYSILDDESLVEHWLHVYEEYYDEYENPKNKLYLYRQHHKRIARYWLQHGKHDPAAKNPIVLRGQKMWDKFINKHVCWKSKIDWIGSIPFKKKVDIKHSVRRWL